MPFHIDFDRHKMLKLFHKNPNNLYDKSIRESPKNLSRNQMNSVLNIRNLMSNVNFTHTIIIWLYSHNISIEGVPKLVAPDSTIIRVVSL